MLTILKRRKYDFCRLCTNTKCRREFKKTEYVYKTIKKKIEL